MRNKGFQLSYYIGFKTEEVELQWNTISSRVRIENEPFFIVLIYDVSPCTLFTVKQLVSNCNGLSKNKYLSRMAPKIRLFSMVFIIQPSAPCFLDSRYSDGLVQDHSISAANAL